MAVLDRRQGPTVYCWGMAPFYIYMRTYELYILYRHSCMLYEDWESEIVRLFSFEELRIPYLQGSAMSEILPFSSDHHTHVWSCVSIIIPRSRTKVN